MSSCVKIVGTLPPHTPSPSHLPLPPPSCIEAETNLPTRQNTCLADNEWNEYFLGAGFGKLDVEIKDCHGNPVPMELWKKDHETKVLLLVKSFEIFLGV